MRCMPLRGREPVGVELPAGVVLAVGSAEVVVAAIVWSACDDMIVSSAAATDVGVARAGETCAGAGDDADAEGRDASVREPETVVLSLVRGADMLALWELDRGSEGAGEETAGIIEERTGLAVSPRSSAAELRFRWTLNVSRSRSRGDERLSLREEGP